MITLTAGWCSEEEERAELNSYISFDDYNDCHDDDHNDNHVLNSDDADDCKCSCYDDVRCKNLLCICLILTLASSGSISMPRLDVPACYDQASDTDSATAPKKYLSGKKYCNIYRGSVVNNNISHHTSL